MKQAKPNKTLDEILSLLKEVGIGESEERINMAASDLETYINKKKKEEKDNLPFAILSLVLLVVLAIGGVYSTFTMFELKDKVDIREKLIETNESGGITYMSKNDTPVTYQELMRENDSLHHQKIGLQNSLYRLASSAINTGAVSVNYDKWVCSPNEIWRDAKFVVTDSEGRYCFYHNAQGTLMTMSHVMSDMDSLRREANYYKLRLSVAQSKYGIRVADRNGIPDVKSEKLDSALLLYPHYKDRIEKDENGHWCVLVSH